MKLARYLGVVATLLLATAALAKPVEFEFVAPDNPEVPNLYSRELWAEVFTPSGQKLTLPAFYADGGLFAVRARPDEVGTYRFGAVSETTLGIHRTDLVVSLVTAPSFNNTTRTRLPYIFIDPAHPQQFTRSDNLPYVPVGANLAWAGEGKEGTVAFYQRSLAAFSHANLNWMRIWMAHWDGLNLDWLPHSMGPSPKPGSVDEGVAEAWDSILEAAEENGVYVQMVLQHHGQYTSANDSNWAENPWNAANPGGFLKSPGDFFTDPNARVISLIKYRYIVARYGWSPAIVAYELFNEVHWTDEFRFGHEAEVAHWHSDAATYIRQVDVYGHLITTSTENLKSPIYEKMDYYQPHLYSANMVAAARKFEPAFSTLGRPAFYGEEGDEHQPLPDAVKKTGLDIAPPVWASVMGQGTMAAEPWHGWEMLEHDRLGEVGAVFRFLVLNKVASQGELSAFSAVVETPGHVPLRITPGETWQHRAAPDLEYPVDGTEVIGAADIPANIVGSAASRAEGFPDRETLHLDLPTAASMKAEIDSVAPKGGNLKASVDGTPVATKSWAAGAPVPSELKFNVPAGRHTLVLQNDGPDWVGVSALDLGIDEPSLGLIGRRNDHFIIAWVWNRANLYELDPKISTHGTVVLKDVAAGSWKVTWWDSVKGAAGESKVISHPGGTLRLQTPEILRHAAVALSRTP
ncbi:MAG TPA: cellulase family glycosylhydrolase [Opitutaceae bacterium]|jgi:hypothetical protein|nr:cellulase family glycosylhydrolase [Opitutaceae bacterium]